MIKKHKIMLQTLMLVSGLFSLGLATHINQPNVSAHRINSALVLNKQNKSATEPTQRTRPVQVHPKKTGRPEPIRRKPVTKQPNQASVNRLDNRMVKVDNHVHVAPRYEKYWTNRVNRYAKMRRQYYYPHITYNTRSLGALPTANYKHAIKTNMLYRSANLHYINYRGARQLKALHIHRDIDLRAMRGPNVSVTATPQPGEIKGMPDKYRIRMMYHHYPVENSHEEAITFPYRKHFGEAYRFSYWYALSYNARKAYHNSLNYMLDARGPVIYNCTQGRDRTGTLSILLENILGVSKYNIYNDFLLTNHYKRQSNYAGQLERIDTFYDAIGKHYGSMYRYERYGLNLSRKFMANFRHKFLYQIK